MKLLFRSAALEKISSPEQLDKQTRIITPGAWVLLVILLLVFLAIGVWAFTGNISDGIRVDGTIFPQTGVTDVLAGESGYVGEVLAQEGDYVELHQIIAVAQTEKYIDELKELRASLANAKTEEERSSIQKQIDKAKNSYISESIIRSPVSGIVQSVVMENSTVTGGDKVATIINENKYTNDKEVIVLVPLGTAKKIAVGMSAQISPTYAPREEYGYMVGYVTKVGTVPVTEQMLMKTFGSLEYVGQRPEEAVVEIRIALNYDHMSKNKFQWSNIKGHELNIDVSTPCNVIIVSESKRPIDLLIK